MNRLNRYSFGANKSNSEQTEPKKRTTLAACTFAENLAAAGGIAPYVFEKNDEATKYFAENLASLDIRVSELDNGTPFNKAVATLKSGQVYNLKVYGTDKTAVAEQTIDQPEMLKNLVFGYCKTSGEYVSANGTNPSIYVNVSSLM